MSSTVIAGAVARTVAKRPVVAARRLAVLRLRLLANDEGLLHIAEETVERERELIALYERALRASKRCRLCGRRLEDPESVARGIGPDCFAHTAATRAAAPTEGAMP